MGAIAPQNPEQFAEKVQRTPAAIVKREHFDERDWYSVKPLRNDLPNGTLLYVEDNAAPIAGECVERSESSLLAAQLHAIADNAANGIAGHPELIRAAAEELTLLLAKVKASELVTNPDRSTGPTSHVKPSREGNSNLPMKPVAYMRNWRYLNEPLTFVRGANSRMFVSLKFKNSPVSESQTMADDVALYALTPAQIALLNEAGL